MIQNNHMLLKSNFSLSAKLLLLMLNPLGYYNTGDSGFIDENSYVHVMGRIDDVLNVAGHRLSSGDIEEAVGLHKHVAECAIIGIEDSFKGQMPVAFAVLKESGE